jgi:hypothetical protein
MTPSRFLVISLAAALGAAAPALANGRQPQCVRIDAPSVVLLPDPDCSLAAHRLMSTALPDVEVVPGACVMSTYDATLTTADDAAFDVRVSVRGAFTINTTTGGTLADMPAPLFDETSAPRVLIPVSGADVVEIRSRATGKLLGELAGRTTGWAEVDVSATPPVPTFLSERLVITHGSGRLLKRTFGELFSSGDEFRSGGSVSGTICGVKLERRVRKAVR